MDTSQVIPHCLRWLCDCKLCSHVAPAMEATGSPQIRCSQERTTLMMPCHSTWTINIKQPRTTNIGAGTNQNAHLLTHTTL
ncbi:hypothetical protein B0O80DRAFT_440284 [Mortierella sp. GBAus27b]|nr:hypothetical protein B0O80DRAFT_440284 [Mortierella sp. GBAus27b]